METLLPGHRTAGSGQIEENMKDGIQEEVFDMKATGIVRRIDDLGRVVIPKEIRRTMRIREGDPLEIYTDKEGGVIFKKYSILGGLSDFSAQVCESMNKATGGVAVVTDRDTCISTAGCPRRDLAERRVSARLEELMEGRRLYQYTGEGKPLPVCEDSEKYSVSAAAPILSEGDVLGCVLFASDAETPKASEIEFKLVQTIAGFLGRHMEC